MTGRAEVHVDAGEIGLAEREVAHAIRLAQSAGRRARHRRGAAHRCPGRAQAPRLRRQRSAKRRRPARSRRSMAPRSFEADSAAVLALALRASGSPPPRSTAPGAGELPRRSGPIRSSCGSSVSGRSSAERAALPRTRVPPPPNPPVNAHIHAHHHRGEQRAGSARVRPWDREPAGCTARRSRRCRPGSPARRAEWPAPAA